jgi:hypothetical protein
MMDTNKKSFSSLHPTFQIIIFLAGKLKLFIKKWQNQHLQISFYKFLRLFFQPFWNFTSIFKNITGFFYVDYFLVNMLQFSIHQKIVIMKMPKTKEQRFDEFSCRFSSFFFKYENKIQSVFIFYNIKLTWYFMFLIFSFPSRYRWVCTVG